ncbi:MAG: substrate-binding domain-containing protein, partial [Hyphomicrobiales bacterium]
MNTTKKVLLAAAALAVSALPFSASAAEVKKIGLAVPNLQADFFNQIKLGVEGYATKLGIEVIVVDAKNDTATQVSQVQDLITQGIDAFIYIPAGAAAAAVPTRLARAEGIPVINVDRTPDGAPGDTFIGGEGVNSAYEVCSHIIGLADGKGKMAIIHGQKGTTPEVDRFNGCKRAIDENPGVELVAQQWSQQWSP